MLEVRIENDDAWFSYIKDDTGREVIRFRASLKEKKEIGSFLIDLGERILNESRTDFSTGVQRTSNK